MCLKKLFNLIFMANTTVHGGLDQSITASLQFTSQMSDYARTNHLHSNYLNITESGNIYFLNGNNITFGSTVSSNSTSINASVNVSLATQPNNIFFVNSNGHTFSSSASGVSTFYWVKTN